ncbi:alcohol dehydrogenase [Verrucomicrobia bacterium SCGC AG-212-E04]|nr:alcohol dehydrogenase [Verrucomicrobia bacterium SCGC AG-212-E04]
MPFVFNIPAAVVTGAGASREVVTQVRRLGGSRVLIVTDDFMVGSGVVQPFVELLRGGGIDSAIFSGVQPDPTEQNVVDGLAALREARADVLVAIGGGSPIDCAKAIGMLATNGGQVRDYMGYEKIPRAGLPLIAIPTTAGTGSEVTRASVITDPARDEKMLLMSVQLVPQVALVDFELTMSMPGPLTAAVGVDTLTHAIEAYVSKKANGVTDPIALSCVSLVAQHLRPAFREPGNRAAREAMSLAACQGGMAFGNSSVCLVHGMSRPIGALFHVPHGISNAMLLPAVTRFSLRGSIARYATVARVMGAARAEDADEAAAEALIAELDALNRDLSIPRLREHPRMDETRFLASLQKMAADALASGSPANNPVVPTAAEIVALYRAAW